MWYQREPEEVTPTGTLNSLTRRGLLTAAGAAAGAVLLPSTATAQVAPPPPPPPAAGVGYTRLAFGDDFDSDSTIETDGTADPGYNWYARQWFGYPTTPADNIQVANSVLTIGGGTDTGHKGAALNTAIKPGSTPSYTGTVFGGGAYFEARIAFDPSLGTQANRHWPCFWSMAVEHVYGGADEQWPGQPAGYVHFSELDFFEAFHAPGESYAGKTQYLGAPHDWSGMYENGVWQYNIQTGNRFVQVGGIDWNQFHTYGTLWVPQAGSAPGYARFYFDGQPGPAVYWLGPIGAPPLPGQPPPGQVGTYTAQTPNLASRTYAILDQRRLAVVLGTDYQWPMRVDWVRVWQQP